MSIKDVISQNITKGFGGADLTSAEIALTLGITFLIAMYLFVVYRIITDNAYYSKNFNVAMVAMSMVTAGIIIAMQSSIVISLGMVGALSIVRFRTAIKEPMDLLFLFWSIGTGIICGAGVYKVAIILAVCVTVAVILLKVIPDGVKGQVLFVRGSLEASEKDIIDAVNENGKVISVKSRNITETGLNISIDVKALDGTKLVSDIKNINGVITVSLVDQDGEFRG